MTPSPLFRYFALFPTQATTQFHHIIAPFSCQSYILVQYISYTSPLAHCRNDNENSALVISLAMTSERAPHDDGRLSPIYLSDNFFLDLYAVLGKETYSSIKGDLH